MKTATLNGRRYKIDFDADIDGYCDQYKLNERYISVSAKPFTRNELITILHECLHAEDWTNAFMPRTGLRAKSL
jgi:hypothetical protein